MLQAIAFTLNGKPVTFEVDPERTLLWVLRSDLALTGAKFGCGEGVCGACTVLVDDEAMPSCQMTVGEAAGREIRTIEGLSGADELHPVQQSFIDHGAIQCGFCTPGIIMTAKTLLEDNPAPTEEEINEALAGTFCRCTGHIKIKEAIRGLTEQ